MRSLCSTLLLVVMLLGGISPAFAATRTWDGGGADTLWSTAGNWSGDVTPGAGDTAYFDATSTKSVSIPVNTTVGNMEIQSGFTGTITLSGGSILSIGTGSYVQGGGTLRTTSGSLVVTNNFTQSGGTLSMGNRYVKIGGNMTRTAGTLNAQHGSVVVAPRNSQTLTPGNARFNNLTISDSLVGYWNFDEGTGTVAYDKSGYGSNGTYAGSPTFSTSTPTTTFANSKSITLNGSNQYVNLSTYGSAFNVAPFATIAFWMKGTVDDGTGGTAFAFSNTAFSTYNTIYIGNGATGTCTNEIITVATPGHNLCYTTSNRSELLDGNWHHVAVTWDGTTTRIYLDGSSKTVTAGFGSNDGRFASISSPMKILLGTEDSGGGSGITPDYSFAGSLDDFRIYSRPLTSSEITQLYGGTQIHTSSGSITLTAAISASGSITIGAGTLDVSSSNYSVTASGSWLNNGGIFTARSGTVTLNGAGRQTVQGGGSSFSTLRILSSSGTTLTDSITVGSALTIGAGAVLSVPTYSLTATNATITNAGTIRQTSGGKIVHTGAVSVSPSSVTPGGSISITVNDSDANTDGTTADTLTAYVRSESEDMTLTETSASSGIFTGSISTGNGTRVAQNGIIEVDGRCGITLEFVYADPQDTSDTPDADVVFDATSSGCGASPTGGGGGGGGGGRSMSTTTNTSTPASGTSSSPGSIRGVTGTSALSRLQQRKLLREKRRSSRASTRTPSTVAPAGPSLPPPATPAPSHSTMTHRIKAYAVNLRQWASPDAPRLAVLSKGTELQILRTIGSWLEIQLPSGQTGFVIGTSVEGK